ncbi:MAG: hypothetical protein HC880_04215 [Bacteroidia bacterium]|nr:hypothetical protein [Bacteroidia bacterium]
MAVYAITEDAQGKLWLGTPLGISKFHKKTRHYNHFNQEDGAYPDAKWAYKDARGIMYFGGVNGFNHFDPAEIKTYKKIPNLVFTDLKLFNQSVKPGKDSPLESPISSAQRIELNHTQNMFSIEFAALNFTSSSKNNYAYKLEGFNEDWVFNGNQRSATYTNLNPGEYTFRVKASNNDNVWNQEGIAILIVVKPPFWKTWWFSVLLGGVLIIVILGWIRLRLYLIKQKKKELQQLVDLRTAELKKANALLSHQTKEIKAKNEDLEKMAQEVKQSTQMKINFFTNISHEFRTPLTLILAPLEKLRGQLRHQPTLCYPLQLMHENSLRLLRLINQLLDLSKVDGGFMKVRVVKGPLSNDVQKIFNSFGFHAKRASIHYEFYNGIGNAICYYDRICWKKFFPIFCLMLSNTPLKMAPFAYVWSASTTRPIIPFQK